VPRTAVVFYQQEDGTVPVLEWLAEISPKARAKCRVKIERLASLGHELRRPEADLLRDKIYELRIGLSGTNYRLLYFFHGNTVAVLSHGIVKDRVVPPKEIDRAIEYKRKFEETPAAHTYSER
jgi:hypothetical protein